jgi:hypothetical protein
MNTDQIKSREAQPADEPLKKHGDQLEKQVKDIATPQSQDKDDEAADE